jgi:hypothetical protein
MKRFFNVTGLCNPEKHYMVDPLRGLNETILELIQNEYYFTIHAPRQTGKTTLLRSLSNELNLSQKYVAVHFSLETAGFRSNTVEKANKAIIESLQSAACEQVDSINQPPNPSGYEPSINVFKNYLTDWARISTLPIILLIDEIDSLYDDVLISVLRQLRDGFQFRPEAFPSSVALVGLRDVREYKEKVRENDRSIGSGSPFNIKAESLTISNFSHIQIAGLLQQYTDDGGQVFDAEVVDLIDLLTGGQPWLVNALAREVTDRVLGRDTTKPVTLEIVNQAKENLILRRDTHLDSLIDKLHNPRVRPIVDAILSGADLQYNEFNDDLRYVLDLGIVIKDIKKDGIKFSNQIYNEIIPRVLNSNLQDLMIPKVDPQWYIKSNGHLDMDALLHEFQDFYREHSESWLDKFSFHESGKQLLLMAFLQRIVNGGGSIAREMAVGRGRTDLTIEFNGDRFVLELKIKRSNTNMERAYKQLFHYLDQLNLQHGYLVIFELKSSDIVSWEERIKWTDIEYESLGAKKQFTIVEM